MVLNLLEEEVSIDKILMEGHNIVTTDNNKWVKTILPVQILIKFSEGWWVQKKTQELKEWILEVPDSKTKITL